MHFCVFATRFTGGFSVPRKYGLNWFIPALANRSVGSSRGTTDEDGMFLCPCFLQKKSMNCWRISVEDGMWVSQMSGDTVSSASARILKRTRIQGESSRGG